MLPHKIESHERGEAQLNRCSKMCNACRLLLPKWRRCSRRNRGGYSMRKKLSKTKKRSLHTGYSVRHTSNSLQVSGLFARVDSSMNSRRASINLVTKTRLVSRRLLLNCRSPSVKWMLRSRLALRAFTLSSYDPQAMWVIKWHSVSQR